MNIDEIVKEVQFSFTRSSGAGGQHVNKVSTKAVLSFEIEKSKCLTEEEKELVRIKLENRISKEGILSLASSNTRSQLKNKEIVSKRFVELVQKALTPSKKRKPTKRPRSANLKRLEKKKNLATKKAYRKKPEL